MVAGPTSTALRMERASAICPSLGAIARWMGATTAPVRDPFAFVFSTKSTPPEPATSLLAPLLAPSEPATALQTPSTNAALAANACPMSSAWFAGRALPLLNHTPAACRVRQSVATALTSVVTMVTAGAATSVKRPIRSGAWLSCPTPATAMRPSSALLRNHRDGNPERVRSALRPPTPTPTPLASLGLAMPSRDGARRAKLAGSPRGPSA
jgi:hypothetical protein